MKRFLLLLITFISLFGNAQTIEKYDTIIDCGIYKSYYSYKIKGASFCVYKLYKGGGDVPRKSMVFSSTLPHYDYDNSGYDRGHLVNAEDFAYNKEYELATFKYYNCLPQTPKLNRGRWKSFETKIRKESQRDSLLIMCGGDTYDEKLVPKYCWKIVYSLTNGKLLYGIRLDQQGNHEALQYKFLNEWTYKKVKDLLK